MTGREELLQSIHPQMKIDKVFFLKIYGFEISYPGFREAAIGKLEKCGCSKAREYYGKVVLEYENRHDEEMDKAAHWFRQECDKEWQRKEGETKRKHEQEDLQQMSDNDLIMLLANLIGAT